MTADDHATHMRRALELARQGWGRVQPNPMVGAVVVRDGRVVGEGYHEELGGPHAEAVALRNAGDDARGATLYVTLEPCSHHGRTPPCVDAIIAAGVARVVYAADDPNPEADGGAERLRAAGVRVIDAVERDAARALNASFHHLHEHGAPFIALKLATSLDAGIARRPGERTPLTGTAALAAMHALRAGHDAILIGIGTALADDPLLTVRGTPVRVPPIRVVIDSNARLPLTSQLVKTARETPLWVVTAQDAPRERVLALEDAGARVLHAPRVADVLDLRAACDLLVAAGVRTIFVEGGAAIAGSLLGIGAVHRLYIFLAPLFLGPGSLPAFGMEMPKRDQWRSTGTEWLGSDVLVTLDPPLDVD